MQVRRNFLVLERKDRLDDTCNSCRGFEMADIGLHRSDQERLPVPSRLSENSAEGFELDRIAQGRSSAVSFQIVQIRRFQTCGGERLFDQRRLRRTVRHGQPRAAAVLVDCGRANHGQNPVAVGLGVGKPLQDHHSGAFSADITVGCGVERLAGTV